MSVGIIFLVCLAVASGVIFWQLSRSRGIDVKQVAAAAGLTMALCIFFNLGATPATTSEPLKPTTAPAPASKPEPTTAPPPQPAPQPEPSLTFEEFDQRFLDRLNVAAQTLGIDPAESMGTPEHRGNILVYQISTTAHMEENVTASGGLRGVNLITHNLDGDTIRSTLVFFFCAVEAFDPTVDINAVIGALALDPNSPDVVKPKITTINGVTYEKKFVDKKSLILTVKQ